MANCPNDADRWESLRNTPHGRGDAADARRAGEPDGLKASMEAEDLNAEENTQRNTYMDTLGKVFDTDQPVNETGRTGSSSVRGIARDLRRYEQRLREGQQYQEIQRQNWEHDFKLLGTLSSGVRSKWLDWTFKAESYLVNARAAFDKWAMLNAVQPDKSFLDNEFIVRGHSVDARISGEKDRLAPLIESFDTWARPIAIRLGYKDVDIFTLLGEGANALAAPEKNAYLIEKWKRFIAEEKAKPAAEQDWSKIRQWQTRIFDLVTHMDDEDPPLDLYSSGLTNGQARKLLRRVLNTGITMDEVQEASRRLTGAFQGLYQARLEAGLIPAELHAEMPDLPHYVAFQTKFDNSNGPINDTFPYNPGAYHEMQGSRVAPDSAYWTARAYLRRTATELGSQDMARLLASKAMSDKANGRNSGIRLYSYKQIQMFMNSKNPAIRQWAQNFETQGGYITYVQTYNDDGSLRSNTRMYVCFDPNWKSEEQGLDGRMLNAALVAAPKAQSGITKSMTAANSIYGQMFTRFSPFFAPAAGARDFIERSFHIANADMTTADGQHVAGWTLLPRYFANTIPSASALLRATTGKPLDGEMKTLWDEYRHMGLRYRRTYGMDSGRRTFDDVEEARGRVSAVERVLGEPAMKDIRQNLAAAGMYRDKVLGVLDGWNDYFQNIAQFTHFVTLRRANVAPDRAASQVLGSMNLYQTGTTTPVLRALFPFVKPTMQSSAASLRALGFTYDPRGFAKASKRGWMYATGMFALASMLRPLIMESMGQDDETGEYRIDAMSLTQLSRSIPIPINDQGDYFKFQIGYGLPQIIMGLAFGADRVSRGRMTPGELASDVAYSITRNLMPGNWPEFDLKENPFAFLVQAFSPSFASPVTTLATNTDYFGNRIDTTRDDGSLAKSLQGRSSTPQAFHEAAKYLNREWGIDLAPEQLRAASDEMLVGPLRMLSLLWDESVRKSGKELPMSERLDPVTRMLGGTMMFGSVNNVGRTMFYEAYNDVMAKIRRAGIRLSDTSYGRDRAKRIQYQTKLLTQAGFDQDFIQDYFKLEDTMQAIREGTTRLNRSTRSLYMQSASADEFRRLFADRADAEAGIYADCVNDLNYYRGRM